MTERNTTTRDKHRRIIANGLEPSALGPKPPCYWCGEPIDYEAHYLKPLSFTIDHVIPLAKVARTRSTTSSLPTGYTAVRSRTSWSINQASHS